MARTSTILLSVAITAVLLCAGCSKLSRMKYETIHIGMSCDEVRSILGKPKVQFHDSWTYVGKKPFRKAIIRFQDSRVCDMTWYDSKNFEEVFGEK